MENNIEWILGLLGIVKKNNAFHAAFKSFRSINLLIHILKYYNYNHHCSLRQIGVVHDIFVEVERVVKYYIIITMGGAAYEG